MAESGIGRGRGIRRGYGIAAGKARENPRPGPSNGGPNRVATLRDILLTNQPDEEFTAREYVPVVPKPMSEEAKALFIPKIPTAPLVYRLLFEEERTKPKYNVEKVPFFEPYTKAKVVITSVKDLNDFYVIREEDQFEIEKINDSLTTAATFGLMPYHPMREQVPIACAVNDNGQWSRVEILLIEEPTENWDKYKLYIRFIDSGKHGVVAPTDVRALPEWTLQKPRYAHRCSLIIRPVMEDSSDATFQTEEGRWHPDIIKAFQTLGKYRTAAEQTAHMGLELSCYRIENQQSVVDLKLISRLKSWTATLVDHRVAKWAEGLGFDTETTAKTESKTK